MATMNYSSSSNSSSNDATLQLIEQAKENSWNSLPEEQREFFLQTANNIPSYNAATQASMVQQTPRFMPSASNMVQLSVSNYGLMDRTPSASSMGRSMSAASVDIHLQRSTTAHSNWHPTSQDATSDYTFCSEAPARRHSNLESITEGAMFNADSLTEWSPDDYIKCIEQQTPSAFQPSLPIDPQQLCTQLTPSLQWSPNSTGSTSPSTSSTALSTPVTHSSNPMSRQSSYNPHFLDSTAMLRIHSDSSCMLPILPEDGDFSFSCVNSKTISNVVDSSLFPSSFTGSSSENFLSSTHSLPADAHAFVSSTKNDSSDLAEDMRRSTSTTSSISEGNASDASASSSASRQLRRDREIKAQASRKIAPKAIDSDETEPLSSNAQMKRIRSEDGTSKTVGVITKTPYVRPQHPKIMCQYCDERPEGFRGTHELDRHIARAHAPSRKGFICVDYSPDRKFLANCKHCRNKKVYGAYYNAAAHLRRAHFHPRKRGRKGKNDEKRGGIGGGDDPPMDYLKMHWIREVEVDNKPTPPSPPNSASDDDAPEPDNASYDATYDLDTFQTQQPMPCTMSAQIPADPSQYIDYGMSMHVGEPIMYDMPTVAVPFDNAMGDSTDMSNFQFDAYLPH